MSKILIVDDEPDVVMLLQAVFAAAGHVAHTLRQSKEALSTLRALRPEMLILDLSMPEKSGWEVLEEVRKARDTAELPVVVVSATSSLDVRVRAFRDGADDFVVKPFNGDELVARVERIIRRRQLENEPLLKGRLEGLPLSQLLQSLESSRYTGSLRLTTPHGPGQLDLLSGQLHGATCGGLSGAEALWSLLEAAEGTFDLWPQSSAAPGGAKLEMGLQSAMLEAAWVEDELAARARFSPRAADRLVPTALPLPSPLSDDLSSLPIGWLLAQVRKFPRRTFGELASGAPAAPGRVCFAAAWLVEQGHLEIRPAAATEQAGAPQESRSIRRLPLPDQPNPRNRREPLVSVLFDPLAADAVAASLGLFHADKLAGATLELQHQGRAVRLQTRAITLETVDEIFVQCARSEVVMLWIGAQPSALKVPPRLIQAAAGREAELWLVASPETPPGELERALGTSSRWRRLEPKLSSASGLLAELFSSDSGSAAQPQTSAERLEAEG